MQKKRKNIMDNPKNQQHIQIQEEEQEEVMFNIDMIISHTQTHTQTCSFTYLSKEM